MDIELRRQGPSRPIRAVQSDVPLVLHLVYRFDTGGLENGVVNLINHMPIGAYRHAVVALTEVVPSFAQRVKRTDVEFVSLRKGPGHGAPLYPRLWQLFRSMRPSIVHSRSLASLECQVPAALAGVPVRIHGEHGRDASDPDGTRPRYRWIRRLYRPFVHHYIALSGDLSNYLQQGVGVPSRLVSRIHNGVDTDRFCPKPGGRQPLAGCPFNESGQFVVGTVGRMQDVKAQTILARAFVRALQRQPSLEARLRLVMVGQGPLRAEALGILYAAGVSHLAWLPGERADVPDVMRTLDCFVLPSLAEGISNTILESMACALPVLATDVGGNGELVVPGRTGKLVPGGDVESLAVALVEMATHPRQAAAMGVAGRALVEERFSLAAMVESYQHLYDTLLAQSAGR